MPEDSSAQGPRGPRQQVLGLLKSTAPAPARRFAKRVAKRRYVAAARTALEPTLSVVVPVYNVESYLEECLDSALRQTLHNLEVIAVDDGSTDGSLEILRRYEADDHRVRVYTQTNSGQGIARNLGVSHARAEFVTFLDADDTVPPPAYEQMVRTLQRTGSDFVVGSARRMANGRFSPTPWTRVVHESDRLATTIDEFPAAMQDVIACNRVFRTAFWTEKVGAFRGHIAYEDHVPMMAAYVRAKSFDVLARATYNWRQREDRTSTSQQKASLENLLDRIAVKEEAHDILLAEASTLVYDAWVARAIDIDFPPFIQHALAANDMYRNILGATYRTFFGRISPAAMEQVRFFQKLRGWLVAEGRWADLEEASEYFRRFGNLPPTRVEDGKMFAATDDDAHFLNGVPTHISEMSVHETGLMAALETVRWDGPVLVASGFAMIAGLDTRDDFPTTLAWLEDTASGRTVPLEVVQSRTYGASRWAKHHNAGYDAAGFTVRIDTDSLPDEVGTTWSLRVRVTHRGVTREGPVHNRVIGSSASVLSARPTGRDDASWVPHHNGSLGFGVSLETPTVRVENLKIEGRKVTGVLRATSPDVVPVRIELGGGDRETTVVLRKQRADGGFPFVVTLPPGPARTIVLSVFDKDKRRHRATWPADLPESLGSRAVGALHAAKAAEGGTVLHSDSPRVQVHAVSVTADAVEVEVDGDGVPEAAWAGALLASENDALPLVDSREGAEGHRVLSFGKRFARLGGPVLPAPSGNYHLTVPAGGEEPALGTASAALTERLPEEHLDADFDLDLVLTPQGPLRFAIEPPLAPEERFLTAQKRMQRAFRTLDVAPQDAVFFQCYRGEFATDSQLALDEGLQKARPDLTRYWGVKDLSTAVPEGAVPVVYGSQAWYDALAASRYLCNNIDFDAFFVKRPHQRYLQTFHGYPFKSMGSSFWAGKGWGQQRITAELARRNKEWDSILVPSEECAQYYRDEYLYEGHVLVSGYPRSDFPVTADRDEVRTRVLGRLGVPTDKTVVLYAPTYRDNLTTRVFAAKIFDELDLDELTSAIGDDFVVLLRGHNNNQRETDRVRGKAQVVDVTDYPEINELTVAADVAILDYSSLRFDWALTGKPMLFFVPDLDTYFSARPPLFDYADTAPGPLLSTTAEVSDRLRHLDEVRTSYGPEIKAFNERFNALHDGHATERVIEAFFTD